MVKTFVTTFRYIYDYILGQILSFEAHLRESIYHIRYLLNIHLCL